MDLKERKQGSRHAPGRLHYARVLDAGMKTGLLMLAAALFLYLSGLVPARVPLDELPEIWTLPAAEYLLSTGMLGGWGWIALLDRGDVLPLLGIAVLSGVPLVSLAGLVPFLASRRDWIYLLIAVLQIGVIALAASGVLTTFH